MEELDALASDPALWKNPDQAQIIMRERTQLEKSLSNLSAFSMELDDTLSMIEMGETEGEHDIVSELEETLKKLAENVQKQQLISLLSGEADANDCFLEIHSIFLQMLLRRIPL